MLGAIPIAEWRPAIVWFWEDAMVNWSDSDVAKLAAIAADLGTTPRALLGVMANESGLNPAAHNPGGAVGLIQFEPDTLRAMGYAAGTDAFAKLSVSAQLDYVARYFSSPARKPYMSMGLAAAYVGAFLPALMAHADDPNYVLCGRGHQLAWAYDANRSFDRAGKGYIVVQDLVDAAERALASSATAKSILARLETTETIPQPLATTAALDIDGASEPES